jgi:transcriptional regulator with XRE-family HTH domain
VGRRTGKPFVEELPVLLAERNMSLRALGRTVGVGDDHLSRVLRGARAKKPTADLARRVAQALDLPDDYFPEARLDFIVQELSHDATFLDKVYDRLRQPAPHARKSGRSR